LKGRRISRLGREHLDDAVNVLASAFHEYPVMRFVITDAGQYDPKLNALMRYFCERRLTQDWPLFGCFSPSSSAIGDGWELVAVAGVNDPGPFIENEAHVSAWKRLCDEIGQDAIDSLVHYERESDGDAPEGTYHFLGIIGVRPDRQGEGHAGALIRHVIQRSVSDPISAGVWLSTETGENVPFYEHLGFHVRVDRDIGRIRYRVMVRDTVSSS
jgi:GNAT superfamily N-acetyltransferase